MKPFPQMEDYLLPLPLPAVVAVLITLGLKYLGARLVRALCPETPSPLKQAAGFIMAASLAGAAVHLLALAGLAHHGLLRIMAWSVAALGVVELLRFSRKSGFPWGRRISLLFQEQSAWGRAALMLLGITALGLGLSALGPPTDADSLDYHLGVPLDILRQGGALPRSDWFHARLTGLGESLNLLGLAGGSDVLGACLQCAGMVAALAAITTLARSDLDRIFVALCLLGCPVLAFLVPNQKPQMLPAAATTAAIVLIASRYQAMEAATLTLACWCAVFAVACKYSFILSGTLVLAGGMLAAYRAGLLGWAVAVTLVAYLVLALPVHLQNYLFYGDPLSPLLERFRTPSDLGVLRFAAFLRAHTDAGPNLWPFPLNLFLPSSLGTITTVLGLGPLLLIIVLREWRAEGAGLRFLIVSALLVTVVILALGQIGARFLLEPYLWIVAAAGAAAWRPLKKFIFQLLTCQLLLMALVAGFGAASLFPGALTASLRHGTMSTSAYGYLEARWLDEVLPPEAVVASDLRSLALMPRPFISRDVIAFAQPHRLMEQEKVRSWAASRGVNALVTFYPLPTKMKDAFGPYLGEMLGGPKEFGLGYRNPWKKGAVHQVVTYRLHLQGEGAAKE